MQTANYISVVAKNDVNICDLVNLNAAIINDMNKNFNLINENK